jgi:hypothetical protein
VDVSEAAAVLADHYWFVTLISIASRAPRVSDRLQHFLDLPVARLFPPRPDRAVRTAREATQMAGRRRGIGRGDTSCRGHAMPSGSSAVARPRSIINGSSPASGAVSIRSPAEIARHWFARDLS